MNLMTKTRLNMGLIDILVLLNIFENNYKIHAFKIPYIISILYI